jgi:hypothetical protein
MTKSEMEVAVTELRYVITLFERKTLVEESPGELDTIRGILRDREAWLRGEVIVPAKTAKQNAIEGQLTIDRKLKSVVKGAQMYSQPEAIKLLRSLKLMNHSPLREVEKEWLDRIFLNERISGELIDLALTVAGPVEMGGHLNKLGQYFQCHNCHDSWKTIMNS